MTLEISLVFSYLHTQDKEHKAGTRVSNSSAISMLEHMPHSNYNIHGTYWFVAYQATKLPPGGAVFAEPDRTP